MSKNKLILSIALIVLINIIISTAIVSLGVATYSYWGSWFQQNILGREDIVVESNGGDIAQDGLAVREKEIKIVTQEELVEKVVEQASPAVVSIIVTKDLPKLEQYYEQYNPFGNDFFQQFFGNDFGFQIPRYRQNGTEEREIGGGSGFIVSSDGLIITNKHVVSDEEAKYTVLMNDENKYEAEVLARDLVNDIAVLKINKNNLSTIQLSDSENLKVGQTVIAIGNALGEYRNTVSTGVISGLQREILASSGFGQAEELSGVIQTDAAINLGNSGGPLLNLKGEAIGVNAAIVSGSQNIGFALPINDVKKVIESVKKHGKIVYPWIGVRYTMIDKSLKEKNQLPYDFGALILRGESRDELSVMPGSPADKAGIVENDIILEVNGKKIENNYTLSKAILNFNVGDEITLKIYHKGEEKEIKVKLEERK